MSDPPNEDAVEASSPAPDWYLHAMEATPERRMLEVFDTPIEALIWDARPEGAAEPAAAASGIVFIHGGSAHADWWSFIAPFFTTDPHQGGRRCAALSLSGMGGSGRRVRYSYDLYLAEVLAVIEAADLGPAPIVVAHSFGVGVATHMAARVGERLGGVVMLDGGLHPAPGGQWTSIARALKPRPTFEAQVARFRLQPAQPCANAFLVDHVARRSIRPAQAEEGDGWIWTFDPFLWERLDAGDRNPSQQVELAAARCPLALIVGDRSAIMPAASIACTLAHAPPATPLVVIPEAGHHVMLDQPLALISALRALLASRWAVETRPHTRL